MTDAQHLLEGLNPQQRAAVTTVDGPLMVIAGAGSGKTRVITHRIAHLIQSCGVEPSQIFAATFTNKAAEEMRLRVGRLLPGQNLGRLAIATFHSQCVSMLRRDAHHAGLTSRFTICDDTDQIALIKDCQKALDIAASTIKPEQIRNWITTAKILMLDPEQAPREMPGDFGPTCAKVYKMYQERLLANDAVDFDDLILHMVRILQDKPDARQYWQSRWRYLLVDEYQDTNRVQFEFIRLLGEGHGNICVVGDEDQSIYSWRGAEIENLLQFPDLFPGTEVIRLEQNYRSTETVLEAANHVIEHNTQRMGKNLWSDRGAGEPLTMIVGYNEREEAALVVDTMVKLRQLGRRFSEMAIFYRINALSRVFEDHLRQRAIPYKVIGGIKFYDRAEVKDLLAYLRIVVNPRDSIALTRIINRPTRGIGAKSIATLFNASVTRGSSIWDVLVRMAAGEKDAPKVSNKARAGILDLIQYQKDWSEYAETHHPHEVLEKILRDTDYEASLGNQNDLEVISRRENIGELISALEEHHEQNPGSGLDEFLERVALVNAQDDLRDEESVSLMTLHCAKGLEYDVVFMAGMEDPIFPSQRAVGEQGHFEEERRLFYVGITRARDLLFFSRADSRILFGRPAYNTPSLFLREIPSDLLRTLDDAHLAWSERLRERRERQYEAVPQRRPAMHEPPDELPSVSIHDRGPAPSPAGDEEGLYPVGARVRHPRLGEGAVIGVSGAGDRRKVTVKFDAGLELEILEQYGGLEIAEDDAGGDLPY